VVSLADIQEFARRVAEAFHPERIILFGSYAAGAPGADSDVDLLVVMPHEGKPWRKATEIRGRARPPFPLDLLVRSPEELRARLAMGDCFLQEICDKGRVLYEAPGR
jgi:predicted nucleotidyltransferase